MDKTYQPQLLEKEIYQMWEKGGYFTPKTDPLKKPFTIIMPPPNANDDLHIGHARFVAVEDILIRYHRMKGEPTLWLPGADHAGIETQYVFEKKLGKEGKSRFDFERDILYKMIWDYVQTNKENMENQLRILGASCDWTREKFMLDPEIVKIVYATFKKLYDEGLIYRGERIINYCPRCGTSFSQLEVDYQERDDNLYYLDYGSVTIATTRPETIFADTAIAVNKADSRYKHLIGKTAKIPLLNKEIPIIADELVDIKFGTGALKVTPGHDATDFEIGQKHKLPTVSVIDTRGKMINVPQKYLGMKAKIAREEIIRDLQDNGKLIKTEKIHHLVGICYRDKGLIEPLISKQWFLKVAPLSKLALNALKKGAVKFIAKRYEKIATHWLKNLKDWNISRQIVWGIRIPAWKCTKCHQWIITDGAIPTKCPDCDNSSLTQDSDTFDTWFSSGQWPFATLKTTKQSDFESFYPTSVMETSYDIIPFWVIRMIMLGLYTTGKVPFEKVLIHGLVRDKLGQKISKSKGNVINPIEMVEKYGADAVRMGLIWGGLIENDIVLDEEKIKGQRNFTNKIWNIARFVSLYKPEVQSGQLADSIQNLKNEEDKKLISSLNNLIRTTTENIDKFEISKALEDLYHFTWHEFADKYLENFKSRKDNPESLCTLHFALCTILKLLHPFAPFVTEAVWSKLPKQKEEPLIISPWPKY
ncbi:MAG: valine--tRNA ligase [Patescibacteria group bacterium]|nr:valine--tRNA ligase [Patescibacteria group bacterium]